MKLFEKSEKKGGKKWVANQYYAVIDTNVVVSSLLKSDSCPGEIIRSCKDGIIIPLINKEIIDEYIDVLSRNNFGFSEEIINQTIDSIKKNAVTLERTGSSEIFLDKDDVVFYEIVLTAKSSLSSESYLVTGNKRHFPVKPFVVTPREMLEIINGEK